MRILLPPSEGKTRPTSRRQSTAHEPSFPELSEPRAAVMAALQEVSGREDALEILGVGATLADEVRANRDLPQAPTAPAEDIYSGVLFEALGMDELTGTARKRARASILVISALFGAVRPTDRIPAYRLSMGTTLPELGALARWWRPHLSPVLEAETRDQLIVDCRSAAYRSAWPAPPGQTVEIQALTPVRGQLKVVTHMAKQARGHLARHLCERPAALPRTTAELAEAAEERWDTQLTEPAGRKPGVLRLIVG